jgi:Protein of unknown function (DUF3035)
MAKPNSLTRAGQWAAIMGLGLTLMGCESIRQATGAAKLPPDEFTVLTKAPLVLPPDYNLRPPQPGIASRNEPDPDDPARAALFPQTAAEASAALGTAYSDGEKLLLMKTNALTVDPNIRHGVTTDVGQEDQGPAFAQKVLYSGAGAAPVAPAGTAPAKPAAGKPAAAADAKMPNAVLYEGTGAPPPPPKTAPAQP